MANVLDKLIPDVYAALDVVSRELVGMIPAVTLDADVSGAAVGQKIVSHVAPAAAVQDTTPAASSPDNGDQDIGNVELEIKKSRHAPFRWNGEQSLAVNNGGHGVLSIQQNQIAQAIRSLTNEVESDLTALQAGFSRAYGAPGTTPFGTSGDYTDATETLRILKDNGAPQSDNHLILNTAAGAKMLGKQADTNRQGSDSMLRQGVLLDHAGMMIRESGQIVTHVAGDGASATTNAAGYAVGATEITLASAGTGAVLAGDIITFAGDTNKYVVASGDADVSGGGTITLAAPGLRVAIPGSTTAITVVGTSARNLAFTRSAIILGARTPAMPEGGDEASDVEIIVDPRSGLAFELAVYKQYRQNRYQIGLAWGANLVKAEHTAILLG